MAKGPAIAVMVVVILLLAVVALLYSPSTPTVIQEQAATCSKNEYVVNETALGAFQCKLNPNPNVMPFIRQSGQGSAFSYQTLSGVTYGKISQFLGENYDPVPGLLPATALSPAGFWPLQEGGGTSALDLSGNGNPGTLTNGPSWEAGFGSCYFQSCLQLDSASSQYVHFISFPETSPGSSLTVIGFFRVDSTLGTEALVGEDTAQGGTNYGWALLASGNTLSAYVNVNTGPVIGTTATISAGTWFMGVLEWNDATGAYKMCVDLNCNTGSSTPFSFQTYNTVAEFGKYGGGSYLGGAMEGVQVYTSILTDSQINAEWQYSQEYRSPPANVILPWDNEMEAFLPNQINASVSGTSFSWKSEWNNVAVDSQHVAYPIGAEDAPGFWNGVAAGWSGANWVCETSANGVRSSSVISSPLANSPHLFTIIFTSAGSQVDFYVDGSNVCTISSNVPTGMLSPLIELANEGGAEPIALLWGFGGVL